MKAVNIQGRNLRADNWVGKYESDIDWLFLNFSLRMPERCLPVGSQEVAVLTV